MSEKAFQAWLSKLRRIAMKQYQYPDDCDWSAFRGFWEDGYSPEEAVREDVENSQ